MINKNVADYTNFDGKTNKKIVQAPGGASSFSIGWSNEKTDYGPERTYKRKGNNHTEESQNFQDNSNKVPFNYNQPIRVMEDAPQTDPRKNVNYPPTSNSSQGNRQYVGQTGYKNYQAPQKQVLFTHDSLDRKVEEYGKTKSSISRPPQPPQPPNNQRTCVKIHEQKSNMVLGDNSYNYWKEQPEQRRRSQQSHNRQVNQVNEQERKIEKTSVKVHNPPGGKSSFTLG